MKENRRKQGRFNKRGKNRENQIIQMKQKKEKINRENKRESNTEKQKENQ